MRMRDEWPLILGDDVIGDARHDHGLAVGRRVRGGADARVAAVYRLVECVEAAVEGAAGLRRDREAGGAVDYLGGRPLLI